jgi:NAD(P)-dependent dehydrogenase (short-subunit alcohol dehydrogenase family)
MSTGFQPCIQPREELPCQTMRMGISFLNAAASPATKTKPPHDSPVVAFDQVMAVNVRGVFLGIKHVVPIMVSQRTGSIINIASMAGLRGGLAGHAYTAAKGAVHALTSGQLVRVLEDWSPSFEGFFVYYPGHRQVPASLRAFIDMIRATSSSASPRRFTQEPLFLGLSVSELHRCPVSNDLERRPSLQLARSPRCAGRLLKVPREL